jgi:tRNA pseudouridine55 synthase
VDGVIVADKPAGCTSHDVVNRLRRLAQTRQIGHLGTLDPLATGVLPLVVGRATRLAQYFRQNDKTYEAVLRFGIATDTYDRDGTVTNASDDFEFDRAQLEQALESFRGRFAQTPPPVSAKKVNGVPAYKLARKNIAPQLQPVQVTVFALHLLEFSGKTARISVHCSAGTYVRSIAHEVGQRLGCGAILDALRRTASGDFSVRQAHTLEELERLASEGRLSDAVIPSVQLLPDMPSEVVDALTITQIRHGRDFRVSPFRARTDAAFVKAVDAAGDLIAIGEARLPNIYHPVLVL